jgi:hypothetical protein
VGRGTQRDAEAEGVWGEEREEAHSGDAHPEAGKGGEHPRSRRRVEGGEACPMGREGGVEGGGKGAGEAEDVGGKDR